MIPAWLGMVERMSATDAADIPEALRSRAATTVADTVGVSVAGFRQPEMVSLLAPDIISEFAPQTETGRSTVMSSPGGLSSASAAAFTNATAGSFLELDEGIRPTGHPAMHVVPAAIAAGESVGASGAEVLNAVVLGYEVAARLFRSYALTFPMHPHGHLGSIGAAVAAARLYRADAVEAAAIAATSPLMTSWSACLEGATARNTWMGYSASLGIKAALLARAGFRGSRDSLGDMFGDGSAAEALAGGFDPSSPALGSGYFKQHSACALTHAALDATLLIAPRVTGSIHTVLVETVQNNMKIAARARPNSLSTRFSLPYAVASALTLRRTDPDSMVWRDDVAELESRVTVTVAPDLQERWPDESPARVVVTADNGIFEESIANPRGYWSDPLEAAELERKFLANSGGDTALWRGLIQLGDADNIASRMAELFRVETGRR